MIANGTQNDHSVAARGGRSGCFSIEWRVKNSPGAGSRLLEAAGQTGIECGTVAGFVDARGRKGSTALAGVARPVGLGSGLGDVLAEPLLGIGGRGPRLP